MFWLKKKKSAPKKAAKAKKPAPKKKAVKKVVAKAAPLKRPVVVAPVSSSRILTAEGWRRRRLEQLIATAKRRTALAR